MLRRRQFRVVVRAPDSGPGNFPRIAHDRRARVRTLAGIGAREAMPTLFDVVDCDEATHPGLQLSGTIECAADEQSALVPWDDDDEDATCFDCD